MEKLLGMEKKTAIIVIVSLSVIVVLIIFLSIKSKIDKNKEEKDTLRKAIDAGYLKHAYSISDIILTEKPISYASVEKDIKTLISADGGMFWVDNPDSVYKTVSGKSLGELKYLENKLIERIGYKFDEYFAGFLNDEELKRVNSIVLLAKEK